MDHQINLKATEPLTYGKSRLVFQHPEYPYLLIKVIRPEVIEERFGTGKKWYKRPRRHGHFLSYQREVSEYLVSRASCQETPDFLQKIVGFCETDFGLGLVIRAVRDPSGQLAPTLATLISTGRFTIQLKKDLVTVLDHILESDIIVSDLNLGNLVHDGSKFVLIDGIGNNNPLPFKAISKRLNRRSKLGRFKRLYERIERCKRQYSITD
jgi:hypothetical protein